MNASCLPSGLGTASRICRTVNCALSEIGYVNANSGPASIEACTRNGISVCPLPSIATRQILLA